MTRHIVQCDGARIPKEWASECSDLPALQVNRFGPAPQVTLRLQDLSDPIAGSLTGRAFDLVSIAAYVYVADQLVSRGGETDIYSDNWRRNMMVCVPVGDPGFWNDAKVRSLLEDTVSFVSGETWHFAFSGTEKAEQLPLHGINERSIRYNADCVVLLSGGADSLCATVEAVLEKGLKPVLVSHRSVPLMDKTQWSVVDLLRRNIIEWQFPHSKFVVNKLKTRSPSE